MGICELHVTKMEHVLCDKFELGMKTGEQQEQNLTLLRFTFLHVFIGSTDKATWFRFHLNDSCLGHAHFKQTVELRFVSNKKLC